MQIKIKADIIAGADQFFLRIWQSFLKEFFAIIILIYLNFEII
jgi:hypothetical protein